MLTDLHLGFLLTGLKESLEKKLESWQKEEDHLSSIFRELSKCKQKDLKKENDKLAVEVTTIEKEMLKKVNVDSLISFDCKIVGFICCVVLC